MSKKLMGILLGLCVLTCPIQSEAHERQCPQPIEISCEEAQLLMQIASAEALDQGIDGMRFVMSVVINRTKDPAYPDDIRSVIFQPHQFYTAGMKTAEITPEVHMALAELEMGSLTPSIIAFETVSNNALDVYFTEAFSYRDHCFYTSKIN